MDKTSAAIGYFFNDENTQLTDVPAVDEVVIGKVYEILRANEMGDVLSAEDSAVVRAYLAAIGAANVSNSVDGSIQGAEVIEYPVAGNGLAAIAVAELENKGVWDRNRMQWSGKLTIKDAKAEVKVISLEFDFTYASFGITADGLVKILYIGGHKRKFDGALAEKLLAGEPVEATFIGTSGQVQWGFFMGATCLIITDRGAILA